MGEDSGGKWSRIRRLVLVILVFAYSAFLLTSRYIDELGAQWSSGRRHVEKALLSQNLAKTLFGSEGSATYISFNDSEGIDLKTISPETAQPSSNEKVAYVCLQNPTRMGWSNKIISLSCALHFAQSRNMTLIVRDLGFFTSGEYPDVESNLRNFFGTKHSIRNAPLEEIGQGGCVRTFTWSEAFYLMHVNRTNWYGCPIHPLSEELLQLGREALAQLPASNQTPSVHLRSMDGECEMRYKQKKFVCGLDAADIAENPCMYDNSSFRTMHGTDEYVVLSDKQSAPHRPTFKHWDEHPFFTQYAMMSLSSKHVGNVFSTVDLLVSAWRMQMHGPGTTLPRVCYG